ncbi:MAG: hypothetical protein Q4B82_06385 [Alysiella sp.]|uniref:protein YgfX n=1 Tax=Alysiella sp. TaxID=1872483 RepID=UPI0026DBF3D8|nr:protein YgfX [Alysiella sp.]MDO4434189.1 hypothetical protein [Alysiella sp.]
MPPFAVDFVPSKLRRWLVLVLFIWLSVCVLLYVSGSLKVLWLLAGSASALYAWREPHHRVTRLEIDPQQRATVYYHNQKYLAHLRSGSLIAPHIACLHWQLCDAYDENTILIYQWIFPDSTDVASQRRLRVWATWAQYGQSPP